MNGGPVRNAADATAALADACADLRRFPQSGPMTPEERRAWDKVHRLVGLVELESKAALTRVEARLAQLALDRALARAANEEMVPRCVEGE